MDFKKVKIHNGVFDPKIKIKSVNMRDIKPERDLVDFLQAPANLLENFHQNIEQRRQAGKKPKRKRAIFEFVKLMQDKYPEKSAAELYRKIKVDHPEHKACQIGNHDVYECEGRLYQDDGSAKTPPSISFNTYKKYFYQIKKS